MYKVLGKDTIEMEIVSLIPKTKRGFPPTVLLVEIVNAMVFIRYIKGLLDEVFKST